MNSVPLEIELSDTIQLGGDDSDFVMYPDEMGMFSRRESPKPSEVLGALDEEKICCISADGRYVFIEILD